MSELWKLGSFLRHSSTRKGQIMPLKISHADKHAKMKKKITSEIFDLWNFYPEIFTIHIERFSKIMALLKFQCSHWNSGIWHGLTETNVNKLEDMDKSFLRTVLRSHPKVAIECLFLEVGKSPWNMKLWETDWCIFGKFFMLRIQN